MASEMDGLPEEVRKALEGIKYSCTMLSCCSQEYDLVRAELLRLVRENAALAEKKPSTHEIFRQLEERAERAESELAELKRNIAEAPVMEFPSMKPKDSAGWLRVIESSKALRNAKGQRVALLPLDDGGEG
jgi:hypothetical protein